jgi:prepilin-type N-terminal cleavage/methylation domain-containing protein
MQSSTSRRSGFTLIELLTVMAIITLLIGILTPALGAARDRARQTAIKAQLNAMEVGLESFNGVEGFYPPSNAFLMANNPAAPGVQLQAPGWEVQTGSTVLQGAHLLLDALVGRDFLGYDPKAPVPGHGPVGYDRWNALNDRRQPYIPVDGVDTTSSTDPPEDKFGIVPNTLGDPQPTIDNVLCRVFRDRFGWPILYYRANPSANANTPIVTQTDAVPAPDSSGNFGNGVYDGQDNEVFTSYNDAGAITQRHRISDANTPITLGDYDTQEAITHNFAEFIRSFRSTTYRPPPDDQQISFPRPVKSDRMILLSAGKDGIYGTLDDVGNFPVLSTER